MNNYKQLALQLRPSTFKEFIFNEHIVFILQTMLKENEVPNGLLLSGIRGIGKTTLARLIAKTFNCNDFPTDTPCNRCVNCKAANDLSHPDIIEISGSTNGKIEDVRNIIENAQLSPMLGLKKVFIIDEAQGLGVSQSSWDALLKILEEPPKHVLWVFCTTQKHKIPSTIKSRLVSLDLKAVPTKVIADYLASINNNLKTNYDSSLILARSANNSLRDALTNLEKLAPYCNEHGWESDVIASALSSFDTSVISNILSAIQQKNPSMLWSEINKQLDSGVDIDLLFEDGIIKPVNSLMSLLLGGEIDQPDLYMSYVNSIGVPRIKYIANVVLNKSTLFFNSTNKKLALQVLSMDLCA